MSNADGAPASLAFSAPSRRSLTVITLMASSSSFTEASQAWTFLFGFCLPSWLVMLVSSRSDHPRVGSNGSASARASRMDFLAVVVGNGRPGLGLLSA